jgi:hypothetical protein
VEAGPPQGWYADPEDASRLRWWDGTAWTAHTNERPTESEPEAKPGPEPDPGAAGAPPAASGEAQELLAMPLPAAGPAGEDPSRRLLPWLIGGVLLLVALGATAIVLSSSESDNVPPVTTTPPLDPNASAADADAEALARTAQTAIETFATGHGGSYEGATPEELVRIEPRLSGATLSVSAQSDSYELSIGSTSGNTFTITRDSAGGIVMTCGQPAAGDCPANGIWG